MVEVYLVSLNGDLNLDVPNPSSTLIYTWKFINKNIKAKFWNCIWMEVQPRFMFFAEGWKGLWMILN